MDLNLVDFEPYYNKLAGMKTAKEIRKYFLTEGITGYPKQPNACAISVYFRRATGQCVKTCFPGVYTIDDRLIGNTTMAMADFMVEFDDGKYPELEVFQW